MSGSEFDAIVENRIAKIRSVLVAKSKEYANDKDRLHNFNKAAAMGNTFREAALRGFLLKHIVSVDDMIEEVGKGNLPSTDLLEEKIGDIVNYYILLEASIKDRIGQIPQAF